MIKVFGSLHKKLIRNFNIKAIFLEGFKVCLFFRKNWFWIHGLNLTFSRLVLIFNHRQDSIYVFRRLQKEFLRNCNTRTNHLKRLKICLVFLENGFYFLTKFGIFLPCFNIQWLTRFNLDFSQTLKQVYRKLRHVEKVSNIASLFQKNGFAFIN